MPSQPRAQEDPAQIPVPEGGQEERIWSRLHAAATAALDNAYVPYSNFQVGAAALSSDGRLVSGCNIENAAYGVTLCAECSMLGQLFATGGGTLAHFLCLGRPVGGQAELITPCGRCRQLLYEHRGNPLRIKTARGVCSIDELLPDAFGPQNLERTGHREPAGPGPARAGARTLPETPARQSAQQEEEQDGNGGL
ncbi:Cytidine deaminase [Glutamicibacter creatinolyticus]|uniref:Cytidine deaminase n=2 Tax=Micrococcaceae TaxID=1268 RepID=A0A5B7WQQ6_9MICC|nr:Cytidine deaminase [Glutamicibacter creatinolyticus]